VDDLRCIKALCLVVDNVHYVNLRKSACHTSSCWLSALSTKHSVSKVTTFPLPKPPVLRQQMAHSGWFRDRTALSGHTASHSRQNIPAQPYGRIATTNGLRALRTATQHPLLALRLRSQPMKVVAGSRDLRFVPRLPAAGATREPTHTSNIGLPDGLSGLRTSMFDFCVATVSSNNENCPPGLMISRPQRARRCLPPDQTCVWLEPVAAADRDDMAVVQQRSSMAVATTASPNTPPHSATDRLLVSSGAPRL
jgi:hypothetical protein